MYKLLFIFLVFLWPPFLISNLSYSEEKRSGSVFDTLQGEQLNLLSDNYLIPIGLSAGQAVGDVVDRETNTLVAASADCFPKLQVSRSQAGKLLVRREGAANVSAALGLGGIADADVAAGAVRRFELTFDEVERAVASRVQMRQALSRTHPECTLLRPYLEMNGAIQAIDTPEPPLLIAEVLYAKRMVRIELSDATAAHAQAEGITSILKKLGTSGTARVAASAGRNGIIEITSSEKLPVAYRPAFIPVRRVLGTSMGAPSDGGGSGVREVVRWEEFEPDLPTHAEAWREWMESGK